MSSPGHKIAVLRRLTSHLEEKLSRQPPDSGLYDVMRGEVSALKWALAQLSDAEVSGRSAHPRYRQPAPRPIGRVFGVQERVWPLFDKRDLMGESDGS